jgi:hypothetical protein
MARILVALLAFQVMTSAAHSETPPTAAAAIHTALFTPAPADNRLLRSLTVPSSAHSTPAAHTCCKICSVGKACGNT